MKSVLLRVIPVFSAVGLCLALFDCPAASVRAQSASDPVYVFHTSLGNVSVQLYPDVAPKTVANFLRYVNRGAYNNSIFHRSVSKFIIQGGGFQAQSGLPAIPTDPTVVNEFHLSNTRGTIAMAKLGGSPNSATSQWYFNEGDSSVSLDYVTPTQSNPDGNDGGYTVFGKVTDAASLAVMDELAAVPVPSPPPSEFNYQYSPFTQIPLLNYQPNTPVQFSNLVEVYSITPAAGAHILWNNVNGSASIWSYETGGGTYRHAEYGPYAGYTAKALADGGTDGKTRVLWNKTDGSASIWSLDNGIGQFAHFEFGPFTGYTATALSVAPDNMTHVLWTNTNGSVSVWNYAAASGGYTHKEYGPFAGYTATAIADGPDGKSRLLWTKADGTASLWSFDNTAGTFAHFEFGPYPNWTANALSVGTDGTTHVLWNNTDGRLSLWNYSAATGSFTQSTYGPYAGWTAIGVGDGLDGKTRIQWDNSDGHLSVWSLDNASAGFTHFEFGPFTGWTAAGLAAGS